LSNAAQVYEKSQMKSIAVEVIQGHPSYRYLIGHPIHHFLLVVDPSAAEFRRHQPEACRWVGAPPGGPAAVAPRR